MRLVDTLVVVGGHPPPDLTTTTDPPYFARNRADLTGLRLGGVVDRWIRAYKLASGDV